MSQEHGDRPRQAQYQGCYRDLRHEDDERSHRLGVMLETMAGESEAQCEKPYAGQWHATDHDHSRLSTQLLAM